MFTDYSLESVLQQGRQAIEGIAYHVAELGAMIAVSAGRYSTFAEYLPRIVEFCTLFLAIAMLLLCRRLRRERFAICGMATELELQRARLVELKELHNSAVALTTRLNSEVVDFGGRLRRMEARVGRPDPKIAAAMARAGTRTQDMVECGISHGEVHLLHALNSGRAAQSRTVASGV